MRFLRILFVRSRQKVMTSLALIYSPTLMRFPPKKGIIRCALYYWQRIQTWKDDEFLLGFKFSRVQTKRTLLMEVLNLRRRDVWTVHGWLHLLWFGISASSVKLIEISRLITSRTWILERPACSNLLSFFHLQWYWHSLFYPKRVFRAHYVSMSLAKVICACSLN